MKNGVLLTRAENEFDVWVTADQNIESQQNLERFDIGSCCAYLASKSIRVATPSNASVTRSSQKYSTSPNCLH